MGQTIPVLFKSIELTCANTHYTTAVFYMPLWNSTKDQRARVDLNPIKKKQSKFEINCFIP